MPRRERGARFRVLGPLEIISPDGSSHIPRGKPAQLLAVLLANPGRPMSRDRLVEALWGEDAPRTAATALHGYVSRLRADIEPDAAGQWRHLVIDERGYRLATDPGDTDADEFESTLADAWVGLRAGELGEARSHLRHALTRWRGDAFGAHADHPDVMAEARRLDALRLTAEEEELSLGIDAGEPGTVARARELVDKEPFRERRWALLMTALYRAGRQAEALRTFRELTAVLGEELGIAPGPQLVDLEERILLQDPMLLSDASAPAGSPLPPAGPKLIGRGDAIERVLGLIGVDRLVTIVGVGGMGKSRVAVSAAHQLRDRREDVWFADLTELTGDGDVATAVLNTLGESEQGDPVAILDTAVRQRSGVLVLDNCEHVLTGVAALTRMGGPAPALRILATSRVPIGVTDEHVVELAPLDLPATGAIDAVAESMSGRLLLERVNRDGLRVDVTEETAPLLARLCEQAGGLPLAIELVAALIRSVPLEVVVDRLERDPAFLGIADPASPRGGIVARLSWSIESLDEAQRLVMAGMATFRGGGTIEALRAVLDGEGVEADAVDGAIWELSRRSLVRFDRDVDGRYSLLEPIRRLVEGADPDLSVSLRAAHYGYFRGLLIDARSLMEGVEQRRWYERIGADFANLRAMVEHGIATGDETVLDVARSLSQFAHRRGRSQEGLSLLTGMIERFGLGDSPRSVMLAMSAAQLAMWTGNVAQGEEWLDRLGRHAVTGPGMGRFLHTSGNLAGWGRGDPGAGIPLFTAAADSSLAAGDQIGAVVSGLSQAFMLARSGMVVEPGDRVRQVMGWADSVGFAHFADMGVDLVAGTIALYHDEPVEAVSRLSASLATAERLGYTSIEGQMRSLLAWSHHGAGDDESARAVAQESLAVIHRESDGWRLAESECVMGSVELAAGNVPAATSWFGRAMGHAGHVPEVDGVVWSTLGLARCARASGRERDVDLLEASAKALASAHGIAIPPPIAPGPDVDAVEPIPAAEVANLARMILGPTHEEGST